MMVPGQQLGKDRKSYEIRINYWLASIKSNSGIINLFCPILHRIGGVDIPLDHRGVRTLNHLTWLWTFNDG